MKWININSTSSKENYELLENENVLADITFSKQTSFARIESNLGKRIFSFEKRGFLTSREIMRNEYGIKMGMLEELKPGSGKGVVELDGNKYYFFIDETYPGELKLYDENMQQKLITCNFNAINYNKTKSLLDTKFASLLLVLCWYTFQPHHTATVAGSLKNADLMLS